MVDLSCVVKPTLIVLAGGLGSILRYVLAGWVQRAGGGAFPIGTLSVNVVGCLAIGVLGAYFSGPHLVREEYRLAVLIGLLGGFTTFSSFAWETLALVNDGQHARAIVNIALSNVLGLSAAWLGYRLGERAFGV